VEDSSVQATFQTYQPLLHGQMRAVANGIELTPRLVEIALATKADPTRSTGLEDFNVVNLTVWPEPVLKLLPRCFKWQL
jgi:hypothetical protein